jgi:NAD(P)-dependent dehydrogenase (short-subunit alcohol dehydrogenase family)
MNKKDKVAVVTGSSRGIGFETSLTLARNGFLTYATMRNLQKEKNISLISDKERIPLKTLQLDVTDSTSVNNAIKVYNG